MEIGYAYRMKLRGFSPGAQPRGHIDHIDDPDGGYKDIVIYADPLTNDKIHGYDLEYIGQVTREWRFA